MIDCTLNGFVNIVYISLSAAIIGLTPARLGVPAARMNATNGAVPRRDRASNRITTTAGLGPDECQRWTFAEGPTRCCRPAVAASDRCRNLGRALKSNGQFTEAKTAWRQALDILTKLVALYPDASDLQRRWCDCGNDLAWLLLSHPDPDSVIRLSHLRWPARSWKGALPPVFTGIRWE